MTPKKLKMMSEWVGDKVLDIAIGLESTDDHVRNTVLKKDLDKKDLEKVCQLLHETGIQLATYVLVKAPGLSEKEAIADAIKTAEYVFSLQKKYQISARVLFEPVFIAENTPLEKLYLEGNYKLLNVWSLVEILKKTVHLGEIFVGLNDENISQDRKPYSCKECYPKLIDAINEFNRTKKTDHFDKIKCNHCQS